MQQPWMTEHNHQEAAHLSAWFWSIPDRWQIHGVMTSGEPLPEL